MTLKKGLIAIIMMMLAAHTAGAEVIRGKILDKFSGEEIIGAAVLVKGTLHGAASGLDGSFQLDIDNFPCTLVCSYIGYRTFEVEVSGGEDSISILLEEDAVALGGSTIVAENTGCTESGARLIERNALKVVNIMSAKAIELSPDLTVANVIQRMSGVTMERSSSGEGQYAILRGMDKRYNYTLVNGLKIPSPDNKNRFVPLDIFPSELLDRLEVSKSLTADMEGDGIGGAVNMVMKDAPSRRMLTFNLQTGYGSHFFSNDFQSFAHGKSASESPNEIFGSAYPADESDFSGSSLHVRSGKPLPDIAAGFAWGDRFFSEHLGIVAALSWRNANKGKISDMYNSTADNDGLQRITERYYSESQSRLGAHLKADWYITQNHKIALYGGYMDFRNAQVRDAFSEQEETVRMRGQIQTIADASLLGEHRFGENDTFTVRWSANAARAGQQTPDNTQIMLNTNSAGTSTWVNKNVGAIRRWEHNSDRDISGHIDLAYKLCCGEKNIELGAGAMYRDKKRDSFFHEYTFQPYDSSKSSPYDQFKGSDWDNYDEISFRLKSCSLTDPMNYGATEKISAGYGKITCTTEKLQIVAGLRAEHTSQGFTLLYATEGNANEGMQDYTDLLPDAQVRWDIHRGANLRLSYYKAINRPSFFEIVPYHIINEDYNECGNPDLKHTVAHNFDLRYEYFPGQSEQIMACLFYKDIHDPIEYGMTAIGQETFYMPGNYGNASNWGLEIDVMKYFSFIGFKANYTYTHSSITTVKLRELKDPDGTVYTDHAEQARPLFGQAAHVFNCSVLFKDSKRGWDGQIAFSYTGKRLAVIDRFYENDLWDAPLCQLDASVEKKFGSGFSMFAKAGNLLDTPLIRYYNANERNAAFPNVRRYDGGVVEREEKTGVSLVLGIRWKL
ncbi:MAG: TonB-dependent receptor domain-containing protein [Candidatus Cryptobacteroides sp.]